MTYAFFDVDGTLISLTSLLSFQDYWFDSVAGTDLQRVAFDKEMAELRRRQARREEINLRYYAHFAGRPAELVRRVATRWFHHVERHSPSLFHGPVVARLLAHRARGEEPVFVSGSLPDILAPIAERLAVAHVVATELEQVDGVYTGRVLRQTIGHGKARAIADFLAARGAASDACHAYGDDISDLPMLQAVGRPAAVTGDTRLEDHARRSGWEVLEAA